MSIAAQFAQNSKLYIEGSAATPEVLTAITVGYPTLIAITGHAGVANGDVVALAGFEGADAALLNSLSFTATHYATGASNDTFAINVNTVGKTITVGAGTTTATPSAWIQIKELKSFKPSGASADKLDVTDLDSTAKEYRSGLVDNGTFSADVHILESDPGQAAALAQFSASATKNMKLVSPAKTRTFNTTCLKFPTTPDSSVGAIQTGSAEWQINGTVTVS